MTNEKTTADSDVRSSKTWDPLVRQILEEMVDDPRSCLLRVPEPCEAPLDEPVRSSEPSLTRIERHLVDVHRFEVAQLLLEEAQRVLLAPKQDASKTYLSTWMTPDERWEPADQNDWDDRSRYRISAVRESLAAPEALTLLERCVQTSPGTRPSPSQLASASQRLVPRATTKICLAMAQHEEMKTREALRLLQEVIDKGASELCLSCAWENTGLLQYTRGDLVSSLDSYRKAASTLEPRQMPTMYWLSIAFQLGDKGSALRASSMLGELVADDHPSVVEYVDEIREGRANGVWHPTREAHHLFAEISDRLEGAARKIANGFS